MKKPGTSLTLHGVGRRKAAVARVWLKPGKGAIEINGKSHTDYFATDVAQSAVVFPLQLCNAEKSYDAHIIVSGGGSTGQSGAIKLGISRALLKGNEALRGILRQNDLLTVDSRIKERKKYGQKGARRKFQFVKR
jgi:small subunit ribosomal protein S9